MARTLSPSDAIATPAPNTSSAGGSALADDLSRTAIAAAGASSVAMAVSTADLLPDSSRRAVFCRARLGFETFVSTADLLFGCVLIWQFRLLTFDG